MKCFQSSFLFLCVSTYVRSIEIKLHGGDDAELHLRRGRNRWSVRPIPRVSHRSLDWKDSSAERKRERIWGALRLKTDREIDVNVSSFLYNSPEIGVAPGADNSFIHFRFVRMKRR